MDTKIKSLKFCSHTLYSVKNTFYYVAVTDGHLSDCVVLCENKNWIKIDGRCVEMVPIGMVNIFHIFLCRPLNPEKNSTQKKTFISRRVNKSCFRSSSRLNVGMGERRFEHQLLGCIGTYVTFIIFWLKLLSSETHYYDFARGKCARCYHIYR